MNELALDVLLEIGRTTILLAGAALAVRLLLAGARCSSPTVHRVAWCLVLVQGWLLLRMPVAIPYYDAPIGPYGSSVTALGGSTAPEASVAESASVATLPDPAPVDRPSSSSAESGQIAGASAAAGPSPIAEPESTGNAPSWPLALAAVWLAGMGLLAIRSAVIYLCFAFRLPPGQPAEEGWVCQWQDLLAGEGIRKTIPLRMTAGVGPILCRLPGGCQLLLPVELWRSLSPADRLAVLRHELAHWKRGDTWKSLFVRVLALPHWFNPAAWWAVAKFEEAAEWACDVEATGAASERAVEYARTLLRLGDPSVKRVSYSPAAQGHGLSVRVRRLLTSRNLEDSVMKRLLVITLALGLVVICLLRFELAAKESTEDAAVAAATGDEQRPSKESAGDDAALSSGETPAANETPGEQKVPLELLRYDGKSFREWQWELKMELKPQRRAEAINALAAFGASGYGEEAASAIIEVMRRLEITPRDASLNAAALRKGEAAGSSLVNQTAMAAFVELPNAYRIPPAAAVEVLSRELREGNRSGRLFAVFVLQHMGQEAEAAVPALIKATQNDEDPTVRSWAFQAVATIERSFKPLVPVLRQVMKDSDAGVVESVLHTLVPAEGAPPTSIFQPKATAHAYGAEMYSGYGAMYEGGEREIHPQARAVMQTLLEAVDEAPPPARYAAVSALGRIGPAAKEAVPSLIRAFEKGDPADRALIAETLARFGRAASDAEPALWDAVQNDKDQLTRARSIQTIYLITTRRESPTVKLLQALDQRNPADLRLIGEVCKGFPPVTYEFAPILEKAAQDEDEAVRRAAKDALEAISRARAGMGYSTPGAPYAPGPANLR